MNEADRPLLVGFDGRPSSEDALALATVLAKAFRAPLELAWMYGPEPVLFGMVSTPEEQERVETTLATIQARLEADGVVAGTRAVTGDAPARALYELADELSPRAIVVGSCHRGAIGRLLAGSVATRLLQGSPQAVVIAPKGYAKHVPDRLRTICVGFDDSPESWLALQHGAQLAAAAGARLRLVAAVSPFVGADIDPVASEPLLDKRRRHAEGVLARARTSVSSKIDTEAEVIAMDAHRALESEAQAQDVDLVVVGSRGYGPLHRVFAGSVSTALVNSAPCPVMVVPRSVEFDPTAEGMAAVDQMTV